MISENQQISISDSISESIDDGVKSSSHDSLRKYQKAQKSRVKEENWILKSHDSSLEKDYAEDIDE